MKKPTPVRPENDYFAREDIENKRRMSHEQKRLLEAEQRKAMKDLHFMHCPKCGMKMHEVRHPKLHHIDACFGCGGVFLDKSEIDVIAAPQQKGIMADILNWFKEETEAPGKVKE